MSINRWTDKQIMVYLFNVKPHYNKKKRTANSSNSKNESQNMLNNNKSQKQTVSTI